VSSATPQARVLYRVPVRYFASVCRPMSRASGTPAEAQDSKDVTDRGCTDVQAREQSEVHGSYVQQAPRPPPSLLRFAAGGAGVSRAEECRSKCLILSGGKSTAAMKVGPQAVLLLLSVINSLCVSARARMRERIVGTLACGGWLPLRAACEARWACAHTRQYDVLPLLLASLLHTQKLPGPRHHLCECRGVAPLQGVLKLAPAENLPPLDAAGRTPHAHSSSRLAAWLPASQRTQIPLLCVPVKSPPCRARTRV
jgi:hypothetical protein